jgi:uncharacterized protein DUF6968
MAVANNPIARRTFTVGRDGAHHVEVIIHAPVQHRQDYRCNYEVRVDGELARAGHAPGIDSLQALILALERLGADVMFTEPGKRRDLYWCDQNDDLGLLLPRGIRN